ncbi:DMT family transporter [Caldimonas brevitalea]|uniref:Membrane protein n=1 Tax=Caldimonas brevitalea TaxID=413882 RepID=A0A0G3BJP8_9BURK|nr:DMT family transporter [Caldimonas brevitalea]AKJ29684.1 membrane protein [Caldimonas brevitalea]
MTVSAVPSRPPLLAYAALASSMALVGSYVGLSKLLVQVFPVLLLAWLRFGIGGVAMVGWLKRQPGEAALSPQDRRLLFWESFFGNFLFSVCMLFGVSLTSALAAGVIMAAIPAVVAVLSWWLLGERVLGRVKLGIACAVAGIVLLSVAKAWHTEPADSATTGLATSLWGELLLFAAVCCEATYVVIGKKLTANVSAKRISALVNLWGWVLVTPFGLYLAWRFDFATVSASHWLLLLFYSLAASMVTVWLWMSGLKQVPAASAGVFTVMLPVSAAAVGVLFLGEQFSTAHGAAFALAMAGLVLATWPTQKRDDHGI